MNPQNPGNFHSQTPPGTAPYYYQPYGSPAQSYPQSYAPNYYPQPAYPGVPAQPNTAHYPQAYGYYPTPQNSYQHQHHHDSRAAPHQYTRNSYQHSYQDYRHPQSHSSNHSHQAHVPRGQPPRHRPQSDRPSRDAPPVTVPPSQSATRGDSRASERPLTTDKTTDQGGPKRKHHSTTSDPQHAPLGGDDDHVSKKALRKRQQKAAMLYLESRQSSSEGTSGESSSGAGEIPKIPDSVLRLTADSIGHYLTDEMNASFELFLQTAAEIEMKRSMIEDIDRAINSKFKGTQVIPHGSYLNGFGGRGCDVDLVVLIPGHLKPAKFFAPIGRVLKEYGFRHNGMPISKARVPLLPMKCPRRNVEFDMIFEDSKGHQATRLFRAYSQTDVRVQALGCMVKLWAKNRGVLNAQMGYLSSFNWLMMVIFWAQRIQPAIAPCLHELGITDFTKEIDTSHISSEPKSAEAETCGATLGSCFYSFVKFYQVFKDAVDITTLGRVENIQKEGLLYIKSPFEDRPSSGHLRPIGWATILQEMERASEMIETGKTWADITSKK